MSTDDVTNTITSNQGHSFATCLLLYRLDLSRAQPAKTKFYNIGLNIVSGQFHAKNKLHHIIFLPDISYSTISYAHQDVTCQGGRSMAATLR